MEHNDYAQYAEDDSRTLRERFRAHEELSCPGCGGEVTAAPYAGGGTIAPIYEIRCDVCRLSVMAALGR